jgi:hypothetical protein
MIAINFLVQEPPNSHGRAGRQRCSQLVIDGPSSRSRGCVTVRPPSAERPGDVTDRVDYPAAGVATLRANEVGQELLSNSGLMGFPLGQAGVPAAPIQRAGQVTPLNAAGWQSPLPHPAKPGSITWKAPPALVQIAPASAIDPRRSYEQQRAHRRPEYPVGVHDRGRPDLAGGAAADCRSGCGNAERQPEATRNNQEAKRSESANG